MPESKLENKPEPNKPDSMSELDKLTKDCKEKELKIGELEATVAKLMQIKANYLKLQDEVSKEGVAKIYRKTRYFGFIIQGMANTGLFNPERLAKERPGAEQRLVEHAANLAGHISKISEEKLYA